MRPSLAIVALTSACLVAARAAGAAEWSAAPQIGWSVSHDSNQALTEDGDAGEGAYLNMDLLLRRATPNTSFQLRPHVTLQRFNNDEVNDSDNESVQAAGLWRTPRSLYSAQASAVHENTLNNVDSDLFGVDVRRRTNSASFGWTHDQTKDRHQLQATLSYSEADYQGNVLYRESGYRYPSASITQSLGWSPRSSIQLTAFGSHLDSDSGRTSDSYGAQIGFTYDYSERINAQLAGGYSRQTIEQPIFFGLFTAKTRDSSYNGLFQVTRRDTLGQWRISASRSVTPSGFGVLVTRTEAVVAFDRRIAARWSANASLRHVGNQDVGEIASGEVRNYQRFDAGLSWRASRAWTLNVSTFLNRLERNTNSPLAEGWGAVLSATWVPNPRLLSR